MFSNCMDVFSKCTLSSSLIWNTLDFLLVLTWPQTVHVIYLSFNQWIQECLLKTRIRISDLIFRVGFLIMCNLTAQVKSRSCCFTFLRRSKTSREIQVKFVSLNSQTPPPVIMLHCERLAGRHFLTLAVLASNEPAVLASVSPLRLLTDGSQTDRQIDTAV